VIPVNAAGISVAGHATEWRDQPNQTGRQRMIMMKGHTQAAQKRWLQQTQPNTQERNVNNIVTNKRRQALSSHSLSDNCHDIRGRDRENLKSNHKIIHRHDKTRVNQICTQATSNQNPEARKNAHHHAHLHGQRRGQAELRQRAL
jgi:hypothetical protein